MFLLDYTISSATENMALDCAMLDRWDETSLPDSPRLRFYGWRGVCFTCGVSQNTDAVRTLLPDCADLAKRPSGGGIVDHRHDLTYAFVLGRGHPLCEMRARDSYFEIHKAVVAAATSLGFASRINETPPKKLARLYACFDSPALFDAVLSDGRKIAGAAQKRNRRGILFQGSIAANLLVGVPRSDLAKEIAREFSKLAGEQIEYISIQKLAAISEEARYDSVNKPTL